VKGLLLLYTGNGAKVEVRRGGLDLTRNVVSGEVSEWFKEHAWKACVGEILPWVRIPPSPPVSSPPVSLHLMSDPGQKIS
jgi:hypothetical protein